jgi:uncharacterized membrane protein
MSIMTVNRYQPPHWRRIVLPASIILNLFFAALVGGYLLYDRVPESNSGSLLARALANAEAVLSPADAAALDAIIRRDGPHYANSADALTKAHQTLKKAILADPFDKEAARQALAEWRAARAGFAEDISDTLIDALARISPDGRRRLMSDRRQPGRLGF